MEEDEDFGGLYEDALEENLSFSTKSHAREISGHL